jgi:hypothetical protein
LTSQVVQKHWFLDQKVPRVYLYDAVDLKFFNGEKPNANQLEEFNRIIQDIKKEIEASVVAHQ